MQFSMKLFQSFCFVLTVRNSFLFSIIFRTPTQTRQPHLLPIYHAYRGDGVVFCETSLPFCFILSGRNSFLVYIMLSICKQYPWQHLPPMHLAWTRSCLACHHEAIQLGNTCILFTFGSKGTSCYAIGNYLRSHFYVLRDWLKNNQSRATISISAVPSYVRPFFKLTSFFT